MLVTPPETQPRQGGPRDLFFFTHPERWEHWPFLPVVRRHPDDTMDCGVLYDGAHASGLMGYSCAVFLCLCGVPHKTSYADSAVMRSWWT